MIVVLDLRNGFLSLGASEGGSWLLRRRFGAGMARTSDDFALLFRDAARSAGIEGKKADRIAMSSVVPASSRAVKAALSETFGAETLMAGPGTKTGLKIRTDAPSELGTDLACMAMAANARFPRDLIVVDSSGSALTFSAVNEKAEFLGVAIAPGIETAASGLRTAAVQLPQTDLSKPLRAIGRNTPQSLSSGFLIGYRGLMDGIVAAMEAELGSKAVLVGSGIEADPAVSPSRGYEHYDPWLCLEGLLLLSERNA